LDDPPLLLPLQQLLLQLLLHPQHRGVRRAAQAMCPS
jgi:hypothetical protein